MTELISVGGVCRTAPATPDLLMTTGFVEQPLVLPWCPKRLLAPRLGNILIFISLCLRLVVAPSLIYVDESRLLEAPRSEVMTKQQCLTDPL